MMMISEMKYNKKQKIVVEEAVVVYKIQNNDKKDQQLKTKQVDDTSKRFTKKYWSDNNIPS